MVETLKSGIIMGHLSYVDRGGIMMSPLTVTLQVPYAEDEQQFLLQAVNAAVRTFRSLNGKAGDGSAEGSSTGTAQDDPTAQLVVAS
jgi:hypothetical protein